MRNMLLKAVCLTSASIVVHSNVIEELRKFHELQNLISDNYNKLIITQPKPIVKCEAIY